MYWIEQVERLIRRTLTDDETFKSYIQLRCYPGELSELSDPVYPLVCFKIDPVEGNLGYVEGRVRFWIWCNDNDSRIFTIFQRLKELFHNECIMFEDSEYSMVHIVFKIKEPIRNVLPKFGVQTLLSNSTFRGLET